MKYIINFMWKSFDKYISSTLDSVDIPIKMKSNNHVLFGEIKLKKMEIVV